MAAAALLSNPLLATQPCVSEALPSVSLGVPGCKMGRTIPAAYTWSASCVGGRGMREQQKWRSLGRGGGGKRSHHREGWRPVWGGIQQPDRASLLPHPVASAFVTEDSLLQCILTQRCTRVGCQGGGNAERRAAGVLGEVGAVDKDS